jgi:hypothetical protein
MIIGTPASVAAVDIEQARQEYLQAHSSSTDDTPGGFGCHELLDRSHLLCQQIEDWLLSHPSCFQNPDWFKLAFDAADNLHRLYQLVGAAHLTSDAAESNGTGH